jgi:uncharacterized phage protein (TIGR01671 family)
MTQRVIKFRAWDKRDNQWFMGGSAFDLNYSGSYGDFFFDNDHPANMREADLVWTQFTGLLDCNGKEIYEGDIVQSKTHQGQMIKKSVVICHGPTDWEWAGYGHIYRALCWPHEPVEVIGNIFETPELLNQ